MQLHLKEEGRLLADKLVRVFSRFWMLVEARRGSLFPDASRVLLRLAIFHIPKHSRISEGSK